MKRSTPILIFSVAIATATFFSCQKNRTLTTTEGTGTEVLELPDVPYQYFDDFMGPEMNARAALGRVLFYDKHMSINNTVACASCHKQAFAFADNVAQSRGFENRLTSRNSMPLEDLPGQNLFGGFGTVNLFWDGRAGSLQDLISRPISNHVEMGITDINSLPAKLATVPYYADLFDDAYGDANITLERISESVSFFLQSIRSNRARFDRQQAGENVMTGIELYGQTLFDTKYNCRSCHSLNQSIYMGGGIESVNFVNIGLEATATDKGRSAISGQSDDVGKFRIPNLHNVALTAPYMHDGRFETLEMVIDHYSHGINKTTTLDDRLKDANGNALKMNISSEEKTALIAFLNSLTDHEMITDPRFSNPFKIR